MAISQSDKIWLILDYKLFEGAPEDLMIEGAFDHLFDSSSVMFNSEDGTFSFRRETKGDIFVEGKGIKKHWTTMAINRAGFTISEERTFPYVVVPSENNNLWQLSTQTIKKEFSTIYEMVSYLRREVWPT
jgi:iron complex transport system ATP-binding protein